MPALINEETLAPAGPAWGACSGAWGGYMRPRPPLVFVGAAAGAPLSFGAPPNSTWGGRDIMALSVRFTQIV